jgi:hypothetical protein
MAEIVAVIHPAFRPVEPVLGIPAGEETVGTVVLGVAKFVLQDRRRVRVMDDVFLEKFFLLDGVANQAAEEGDVRPGADRRG